MGFECGSETRNKFHISRPDKDEGKRIVQEVKDQSATHTTELVLRVIASREMWDGSSQQRFKREVIKYIKKKLKLQRTKKEKEKEATMEGEAEEVTWTAFRRDLAFLFGR